MLWQRSLIDQAYDFDTIKLDGLLVRDICTNANCRDIISSIVYLSRYLNYSVLAEYVETDEQKKILHDLGCDHYHGYLFSKPLSAKDFIDFIEQTKPITQSQIEASRV